MILKFIAILTIFTISNTQYTFSTDYNSYKNLYKTCEQKCQTQRDSKSENSAQDTNFANYQKCTKGQGEDIITYNQSQSTFGSINQACNELNLLFNDGALSEQNKDYTSKLQTCDNSCFQQLESDNSPYNKEYQECKETCNTHLYIKENEKLRYFYYCQTSCQYYYYEPAYKKFSEQDKTTAQQMWTDYQACFENTSTDGELNFTECETFNAQVNLNEYQDLLGYTNLKHLTRQKCQNKCINAINSNILPQIKTYHECSDKCWEALSTYSTVVNAEVNKFPNVRAQYNLLETKTTTNTDTTTDEAGKSLLLQLNLINIAIIIIYILL